MKRINWNTEKNTKLILERGICFDDVMQAFALNNVLDDIEHPNTEKYPHQFVFIVLIKDYVYLVPYVENENEIFLKTIIPSRKLTKKYLGKSS